MTPPMSPCPSPMMSIKARRSRLNAIARRNSALSKGGTSRLTIRLRPTPVGANSQIACGICAFTSFHSGTEVPYGQVMSNLPAMKANVAVDRLLTIVYSMPSR